MNSLLILFLLFSSTSICAQTYRLNQKDLPVFELGGGAAWANLPYYPGSSERRTIVLPFPAFVYRGDILRADEDGGPRGRFFSSKKFEINTSVDFFFPVDEKDTPVRRGMNKLDPLIEIGPGLIYHIIPKENDDKFSLSLNISTRVATSTDLKSADHRGFTFNPFLFSWLKLSPSFTIFNGLSLIMATRKRQAYFYDVAANEVTSNRSLYQSTSGVFSANVSNFFIFNSETNWSFFAGLIYEEYSFAANRDSPLHERDNGLSGIFGFTYWFYQSEKKQIRR